MTEIDDRDDAAGRGGRATSARPSRTGPAARSGATRPGATESVGPARRSADRTQIARALLDLVVDEIMGRIKRRLPDVSATPGEPRRRRQRPDASAAAVPISPARRLQGMVKRVVVGKRRGDGR
ncbi:hypothetical protein [Rhodoplanes azumiensis]|uniref:Uncharacterized protein n=1 Tax=Rhodoplanes azumiensis TaxID=1897628 RepID=A0ABW5AEK8_9BRAD